MTVTFSIELNSKSYVKHISVSNNSHDRVLFEGSLGEMDDLSMIEGAVLEVKGSNGVLRVDLTQDELIRIISQRKDDEKNEQ